MTPGQKLVRSIPIRRSPVAVAQSWLVKVMTLSWTTKVAKNEVAAQLAQMAPLP